MNALDAKISSLGKTLRKEHEKTVTSVKIVALVYGLLAIFVFAYTSYVLVKIKELATPATVAAMAGDYAKEKIPVIKQQLASHVDANAADWAGKIVAQGHKFIPEAGNMAKKQIDSITDTLLQELKTKHLPALKEYLKKNVDEALSRSADLVNDDKLAKAYAVLLVEELDSELEHIMDTKVYSQIERLHTDIETLINKPKSKLTKREDAEKRILMYWSYLANHRDMGESIFDNKLQKLSEAFNYLVKGFAEGVSASNISLISEEDREFVKSIPKGIVQPDGQ